MCHCLHCRLCNFFFFENAKIWVGRTTLNREKKKGDGQKQKKKKIPESLVKEQVLKVSVKENEVPTEKNSSRASIFATKASYISN